MEAQWLYLLAAFIVSLTILYMQLTQAKEHPEVQPEQEEEVAPEVRGRRTARNRMIAAPQPEEPVEQEEEEERALRVPGKIGKKKALKMEAKEMKRRYRETQEAERASEKERQQLIEADRIKNEEIEKKKQAKLLQIELKRQQEQAAKEQKEYEEMKQFFVVEGAGEAPAAPELHDLLTEFVEYIQANKIVWVEDLAAKFHMQTKDVVSRLGELEDCGRLVGLLDDRGKYICLTQEELKNVAKFIKQRGRVSIAEILDACNKMIKLDLQPLTLDQAV